MASKLFQSIVSQMYGTIGRVIGVLDAQGTVIACSDLAMIGSRLEDFRALNLEAAESMITSDSRTYKTLVSGGPRFNYAAFVEGTDPLARTVCALAAVAFNEAKTNYEEKHNKAAFVKNIISDNILPGDVYVRAKELHFVADDPRRVLLVRCMDNCDVSMAEAVKRLFPDDQKDFVLNINETDVVLVKTMSALECPEEAMKVARSIENVVREELGVSCVIGISTNASIRFFIVSS